MICCCMQSKQRLPLAVIVGGWSKPSLLTCTAPASHLLLQMRCELCCDSEHSCMQEKPGCSNICIRKPPALLCQRLIVAQQQYVANMVVKTTIKNTSIHCDYYYYLLLPGGTNALHIPGDCSCCRQINILINVYLLSMTTIFGLKAAQTAAWYYIKLTRVN